MDNAARDCHHVDHRERCKRLSPCGPQTTLHMTVTMRTTDNTARDCHPVDHRQHCI